MAKTSLLLFLILMTSSLLGQQILTKKYTPEQCIRMIQEAADALRSFQPGVYRYHTREDFDRYLDSIKATVQAPLTELELYRKLKPLVSRIGCLHTDLVTAVNYKGLLNKTPNLLPLQVYGTGERAFVVKNYTTNNGIVAGDEIMAINGRPMPDVLRQLLAAIPSDGYNQTMKYLALYHMFPLWYRSIIEVADTFTVTIKHNGIPSVYVLPAAQKKNIEQDGFLRELHYPRQLEFNITGNTGVLTIHTFANSLIRKGDQNFKVFIDRAFAALNAKGIPDLIVDLRYNTGGSDANAAYFTRFFFDKPYRYWYRIEVTEKVAGKIRGLAGIWYRKPVKKDSTWLWQKGKRVRDFDFYEQQYPSENAYKGNVYVLINGFCMSSCADVASVLSYNRKAVFVGTETGGGFQGNNSGIMPGINLRPSKMVLTVPLQQYFTAVDPEMNVGKGTLPDLPVIMTIDELARGIDKPMEAAMDLIRSRQ
ncbi:S41 family peptidase [Niabella pedocola]|uniref:S41 family peptidase n=1 Tax=Niabella pedocola TaxID=1752077 RepID=A0ABS8PU70_9BACT|nr:S41 family peptidase [Niabella pedocola]MCD2424621.1 S41 family peptidase [Niabella pedocola]